MACSFAVTRFLSHRTVAMSGRAATYHHRFFRLRSADVSKEHDYTALDI